MHCSGLQTWTWGLFLSLCCIGAAGEPVYMVAIPAMVEAGAEVKICSSLLQPNETLTITVTLVSDTDRKILFQHTSSEEYHICSQFQAPRVLNRVIHNIEVEVRGLTFFSKEVKKIEIRAYPPVTFIQTDKPIYLPGQTVHFRVVTLDTKFRPVNVLYDIIEIEDRAGNRIGQWRNMSSNGTILQLSYDLNPEAGEGSYKIYVVTNDKKIQHKITVDKYVLPKFSVTLISYSEISVGDKEYEFKVCGKYTFGQPVPGTVEVELCQHPFSYSYGFPYSKRLTSQCYKQTQQTGKDGCAPFTFEMVLFTNNSGGMRDELHLKAKLEEEGTGIASKQEHQIKLSYLLGSVYFVDAPSQYKRGSVVSLKVKAVHYNKTPVSDRLVYLSRANQNLQSLSTNSDGFVTFLLNTTEFSGMFVLKASLSPRFVPGFRTLHFSDGFHELVDFENSHVQAESALEVSGKNKALSCDAEEDFSILYTLVGEAKGSLQVMYLVISKNAIIKHGHYTTEVQNNSVIKGVVPVTLLITAEMAPAVQIIAYAILPSKKVIANSANFPTEFCFSSKVSVEFSSSSAVPGEDLMVNVDAPPSSLCGLRAIDQSVLIKESLGRMHPFLLFYMQPVKESSQFPSEVEDAQECVNVRQKRYVILDRHATRKDDVYTVFKKVGLKMATNVFIRMPSCLSFNGEKFNRQILDYPIAQALSHRHQDHTPQHPLLVQTIRSFFPETWLWSLVDIGETGSKQLSVTAPDTITTWEMEAFCVSPLGFGLAPRKELTVFQPFFLELSLPYSIIRGEHFELKATVFNYLSSCIMISVVSAPSMDYTLSPVSGDQYQFCICVNDRKTVSWTMIPSALGVVNVTVSAEAVSDGSCDNQIVTVPDRGHIDVVTKSLIVKAEGTEMTKNYNWLLCPKGETLSEKIFLQLPDNVIAGSARGSVSVLGDILGRAMKNLDGLLRMPYGCGEQNMALLAPNIYILQYLKNTQQLTPAITKKANHFLTSGYQRQMNYRHSDGSYSTFGTGSGNTWLTAFVVRSFAKAESFIYIDQRKISHAMLWLTRKQKNNGCFEQSGKLFNNRMKGGVSDEVTLSAYISAAFLEMKISATTPMMNRSLSCLRESIHNLNNTYTTALLAYVFTLAEDMEMRAQLLAHLHKVVHEKDGLLHWGQSSEDSADSLSVEISSYVLLAKLSASPSTEDLRYASQIVRWLTTQQNQYGGFSSTQDTVVALQALALYSTLVYSSTGLSTVNVKSPSEQMRFEVTQDNKLLYQEKTLTDLTGHYVLEVNGSACVSMQISLHYNIPTPTDVGSLKVEATSEVDCQSPRPALRLKLSSLYFGHENYSNMVILDIKVLSGFAPDPKSLRDLQPVDRVDKKGDHILVYLRELPKDQPVVHDLKLTQELTVQNLKPGVVKIYDYYQPSDQAETEYTFHCDEGTVSDPNRK